VADSRTTKALDNWREWDFRTVAGEHLRIATEYEYLRSIPELSDAIQAWHNRDLETVFAGDIFYSRKTLRQLGFISYDGESALGQFDQFPPLDEFHDWPNPAEDLAELHRKADATQSARREQREARAILEQEARIQTKNLSIAEFSVREYIGRVFSHLGISEDREVALLQIADSVPLSVSQAGITQIVLRYDRFPATWMELQGLEEGRYVQRRQLSSPARRDAFEELFETISRYDELGEINQTSRHVVRIDWTHSNPEIVEDFKKWLNSCRAGFESNRPVKHGTHLRNLTSYRLNRIFGIPFGKCGDVVTDQELEHVVEVPIVRFPESFAASVWSEMAKAAEDLLKLQSKPADGPPVYMTFKSIRKDLRYLLAD
jgi:hypothetical protein